MTNKEWLSSLSDEELADWLTDLSNGKFYPEDLCMDFARMQERMEHVQNVMRLAILNVSCLSRT